MSSNIKEAMESYYDSATLWFGIHKGKPLCEIPKDYLLWVKKGCSQYKDMSKSLKKAINYQLNKPCQ